MGQALKSLNHRGLLLRVPDAPTPHHCQNPEPAPEEMACTIPILSLADLADLGTTSVETSAKEIIH